MQVGVLVVNFGEPSAADPGQVEAYLQRIFLQNMSLEAQRDGAGLARSRQLAKDRAPALLEVYRDIGGSPLNAQSAAQAEGIAVALHDRGIDARVYVAFQFTDPSIRDAVSQARQEGASTLVVLPGYPLCGQSTTIAALDEVSAAMKEIGWSPRFGGLAGWHHHPAYVELRAGSIRSFVRDRGLDLSEPDTLLYFSVHGTPVKYLREGNRYDRYVDEHCRDVAGRLGADRYAVGFQNHTNRKIAWTQPDNEARLREAPEGRLVVVPISFMKEQSETLAELDHELRAFAEGLGKEFHRVPVPHEHAAFPRIMADLTEQLLADDPGATGLLSRCRCSSVDGAWCTNGMRDLPPSPYIIDA